MGESGNRNECKTGNGKGNRNFQKELDQIIEGIGAAKNAPALFLHSCCAPCSSYVLEYLRAHFRITVFYYNPNITENAEYALRVAEQKRLIAAYNAQLSRRRENVTDLSCACGMVTDASESLSGVTGVPDCRDMTELSGNSAEMTGASDCMKMPDGPDAYEIRIVEGDYEPEKFFEAAKGLEHCPEGGARCFCCYELRLRESALRAAAGGYDYFATTLTVSPLKNAAKLNEIGERLGVECGVPWLPSDFKKRGGYGRSVELSGEYGLYRQDYCGCVYSRENTVANRARIQ